MSEYLELSPDERRRVYYACPSFTESPEMLLYIDDPLGYIRDFHLDQDSLAHNPSSSEVDALLGWRMRDIENAVSESAPKRADIYDGERPWLGGSEGIWTAYPKIRSTIHAIDPTEGQTFYDLGSGQGRVVMYGSIVSGATFKGVEMVSERVAEAKRIRDKHSLTNAEFILSSVLDVDFSDGDIFYMYAPFSDSTRDQVLDKLNTLATEKLIKVVAYLGSGTVIQKCPNLQFDQEVVGHPISIFSSRN